MIFVLVVPAKNSNIATAPIFNARFLQVWVCFFVREPTLNVCFGGKAVTAIALQNVRYWTKADMRVRAD